MWLFEIFLQSSKKLSILFPLSAQIDPVSMKSYTHGFGKSVWLWTIL
jgi:hypothetical protein